MFAAQYLPTLTINDVQYGDWYLPSWHELIKLVSVEVAISASGYNSSHYYWSSTETNGGYAYRAGTGGSGWDQKSVVTNYVLPIRQF